MVGQTPMCLASWSEGDLALRALELEHDLLRRLGLGMGGKLTAAQK